MKKWGVSKNFRLSFSLIMLGLALLLPALFSFLRFQAVSDLNSSKVNLHAGEYLRCTVSDYFVLPLIINGNETGSYVGRLDYVSANLSGQALGYHVFFAKTEDGRYVRLGIQNQKLIDQLDSFEMGHGNPVTFVGKVMRRRDDYRYLESIRRWENFDESNYLRHYYVLQIDEVAEKKYLLTRLLFGAVFLLAGILLFFCGFGFYRILVKPFEKTPEYVKTEKGVNYLLKEELELKQKKLKLLHEKQSGLRKWALLGILFFLAGVAMLIDYYSFWHFPYLVFVMGFCLILIGVQMIWHAFIQSNAPSALRLADRLTIDTYAVRIKKEEILIGVLSRRLDEKKRKKREADVSSSPREVNSQNPS